MAPSAPLREALSCFLVERVIRDVGEKLLVKLESDNDASDRALGGDHDSPESSANES